MPQPHHKKEQPKFLTGRKPITQITERPILQPPKFTGQKVEQVIKQPPNTQPYVKEKPKRTFHPQLIKQTPKQSHQ